MTLLHEQFFDEDARDRHNAGWTSIMDRLETVPRLIAESIQ